MFEDGESDRAYGDTRKNRTSYMKYRHHTTWLLATALLLLTTSGLTRSGSAQELHPYYETMLDIIAEDYNITGGTWCSAPSLTIS